MKSTGIVRRVDELGRIVLPIELRRTLDIAERDPLEIYVDGDSIVLKKYQAYHGTLPRQEDFKISPHASVPCRESVLTYNRFIIKGWNGIFSIKGSPELIRLALLGGIGARNSIGLGFVLQKKELA